MKENIHTAHAGALNRHLLSYRHKTRGIQTEYQTNHCFHLFLNLNGIFETVSFMPDELGLLPFSKYYIWPELSFEWESKCGLTSMRGCQWAMGLRGYVNISFQCSLPKPSASLPTRHTPMTSLWPTLCKETEKYCLLWKTTFCNLILYTFCRTFIRFTYFINSSRSFNQTCVYTFVLIILD